MSDLKTIRQRIEAGDQARFYLDYYGSHWVELKSSMLIPFKRRIKLSPAEAMQLRDFIARRTALLPPRQNAGHSYYRAYRGGIGAFFHAFLGNELMGLKPRRGDVADASAAASEALRDASGTLARVTEPWLSGHSRP